MQVKEFIVMLSKCDPRAYVRIAMLEDDDHPYEEYDLNLECIRERKRRVVLEISGDTARGVESGDD